MSQGATVAINVLDMNLQKLLELLFVLFAYCLQHPLDNEAEKSSRFECLNAQITPA